ncbi:MAG: sulfatase [Opitutaceae bacterium]|nr:sulfatase [Opitutaceae bacterium]
MPPSLRQSLLLLVSLLCFDASLSLRAAPPNIVFILADDLGWNGIGPYGNKHVDTPHLDRLAREGMTFHRAYAEAQCSPTRGAFFSGQWPARTGMFAVTSEMDPFAAPLTPPPHAMAMPPSTASLALMLRSASYANGLSGKWHIGDGTNAAQLRARDSGKYFDRYGFDFVGTGANASPEKDKSVAGITDDLLGFIERNRGRPFFAFFSHHAPHTALEPPRALVEKYVARGLRKSSTPETVYAERTTADYYATIEHLDTHIGRVLTLLDRLDLAKNTIVIFTSDNGGLNRAADMAPLRGNKGMPYEGGVRVPLLVRWPGRITAGSANAVPVHFIDWYLTFAAIAGAKLPTTQRLDGENLVPLLTGTGRPARDTLYWHMPTYTTPFGRTPSSVILRDGWKLIHYFGDFLDVAGAVPENQGAYGKLILGARTELYHLDADPSETHNLAEKDPAKAAELMAALKRFWLETSAALPVPNPTYRADNPAWWQRAAAPSSPK